jgi:hypothetical protein
MMKLAFVVAIIGLSTGFSSSATASTASQREYKRGYADCSAGRFDREQHGVSYKNGCRAAEDKKGAASGDAKVPGAKFHATGELPCAAVPDAPMGVCEFGVVRRGRHGDATVTVTLPGGSKRNIVFKKGAPVSSDAPDAVTSTKADDLTKITIGGAERYEIRDVAIFGD